MNAASGSFESKRPASAKGWVTQMHRRPAAVQRAGVGDEGWRRVDGSHMVASFGEVSADPTLAASDLEGTAPRPWNELFEEDVAVVPVGIVTWCSRPGKPLVSPVLPIPIHCHGRVAR
jgi:hypothetical protein